MARWIDARSSNRSGRAMIRRSKKGHGLYMISKYIFGLLMLPFRPERINEEDNFSPALPGFELKSCS